MFIEWHNQYNIAALHDNYPTKPRTKRMNYPIIPVIF